jgi:hypothetical protein
MKKKSLTFIPPAALAIEASRGLLLRKKFGRGGTMIGVARARDLKNRRRISAQTVKRMYSYFARHLVDKQGRNFFNQEKPSNGAIAWLLWGGDAGARWAFDTYQKIKHKNEI